MFCATVEINQHRVLIALEIFEHREYRCETHATRHEEDVFVRCVEREIPFDFADQLDARTRLQCMHLRRNLATFNFSHRNRNGLRRETGDTVLPGFFAAERFHVDRNILTGVKTRFRPRVCESDRGDVARKHHDLFDDCTGKCGVAAAR